MFDQLLEWDRETLLLINGLGSETYDDFWLFVTEIETWIPLFLLFGVLIAVRAHWRKYLPQIATVAILATFITWFSHFIKIQVQRVRPCNDETLNAVMRILRTPADYSFFSGHASSSFAVTVLVFLLLKGKFRWAGVFFVWPLLFSYSRLYLGVHFPLDVLFGAITGTAFAWLFYVMYQRFIAPYSA